MRAAWLRICSSVLLVAMLVTAAAPRATAAGLPVDYRPPVDAPIADPFRPPAHRYGPGNRGMEYRTVPGTEVRAVAPGVVTFAGQVGGTLHVTVLHADGLRSTVSYLDRIDVRRGDRVVGGEVVGLAGSRTHLGVRAGDDYLDPATLFTGDRSEIRLVPTAPAGPVSVASERTAIARWLAGVPGAVDRSVGWIRGRAVDAASLAPHVAAVFDPTGFGIGTGLEVFDRLTDPSPCTPPDRPVEPPAGRRVLVLVGGLGSTGEDAAVDRVDAEALGYDPADVYRFSYAGGRVPDATDSAQQISARDYGTLDSQADLTQSGRRLQQLVDALALLDAEVPIDIVAHSQGGLVARLALDRLADAGDVHVLGEVVTIGTPHQGADLASAAAAVRSDLGASRLFDLADDAFGTGLRLGSPSIEQLAVGSSLTTRLDRSGVPERVSVTSIGARGDLVVAASRTQLDGAVNVTTALTGLDAHDALPSDPATTREIGLAISGSPPTCESNADIVADVIGGRLVSQSEQWLVAGIFLGGLAVPG